MSMSGKKLGRVVFIRHGESVWNVNDPSRGYVSRFTGWADVSLTDRGKLQAAAAGRCLNMFGLKPDAVYTSLLRRSKDTYKEIANSFPDKLAKIPLISSWRLNERHYGALVGLSKDEAAVKLGYEKVMEWRRSWDVAPPEMHGADMYEWEKAEWAKPMTVIYQPGKEKFVSIEKGVKIPKTESLQDCVNRVLPLWINGIAPRVARGETVLVVAHANSIRSAVKHIDNSTMTQDSVRNVHIPSATPLIYNFMAVDSESRDSNKTLIASRSIKPMGDPNRLGMTGRYVTSRELMKLSLENVYESYMENEDLEADHFGQTSFYDLFDKGLTEIKQYADSGSGKSEALIVTDGRGFIVHANQSWEDLCGFTCDEIKGHTNEFLQGPLTEQKKIDEFNYKVDSGLPVKTNLINYRKSGEAFDNHVTVIPVYSWLNSEDDEDSQYHRAYANSDANYEDTKNVNPKKIANTSGKILKPSHYVARLDKTPNLPELPKLTEDEMKKRGI